MRVLIFKVNQLGDNLVFLPVVQELRRRFPEWELAICTSPLAEALYAATIPEPARRLIYPTAFFNGSWKRPADFWHLWWRVVRFRPDACLIADDQANVAYLLAFLGGARIRVALSRPFIKIGALATLRLPMQPEEKVALANWRVAEAMVAALGGTGWPEVPAPPDLSHLLVGSVAAADKRRVVIHAGASRAYQRWFPERFVELANRLAAQDRLEVQWINTPGLGDLAGLSPAITIVQTPILQDLAQTLNGAALFVGNNSGPMHLANALGCPCVIINGPTSYHWDPAWYTERMLMLRDEALSCLPCDSAGYAANICRRVSDPMACMKFWTVDAIFERCLEWLRRWMVAPRLVSPAAPLSL